jgi:hypothetical protein
LVNYGVFNTENTLEALEDSYDSLKNTQYLFSLSNQKGLLNAANFSAPIVYSTVLDAFRADFDDLS